MDLMSSVALPIPQLVGPGEWAHRQGNLSPSHNDSSESMF